MSGSGTNTIFDDVFRTIVQKMPKLVIPLINEVFHTSYPDDVEITQWSNEQITKDKTVITDSCLRIGNKVYHIECQSTDDTTMAIRMIEYDFSTALNFKKKDRRNYILRFPYSAVLQLRENSNTPDILNVKLIFADGGTYDYQVPVVKVNSYTKDNIFEKKLLMLLPFYIMRYEKKKKDFDKNPKELAALLDDYRDIQKRLEEATQKSDLYTDLMKLITKIADYIFRDEPNVKKGLGDVMGGQILELETEKQRRIGKEAGRREGLEIGRREIVRNMLSKNKFSYEEIADLVGISTEKVKEIEQEALAKN